MYVTLLLRLCLLLHPNKRLCSPCMQVMHSYQLGAEALTMASEGIAFLCFFVKCFSASQYCSCTSVECLQTAVYAQQEPSPEVHNSADPVISTKPSRQALMSMAWTVHCSMRVPLSSYWIQSAHGCHSEGASISTSPFTSWHTRDFPCQPLAMCVCGIRRM